MTTQQGVLPTIETGFLDLLERMAPFIPAPEGPGILIGVKVARAWMQGKMNDSQVAAILQKTEKDAQAILDNWSR